MIIVSTMSETEARQAAAALGKGLPRDTGYEVYLRGSRYAGRETVPPATDKWGNLVEEDQ